MLSTAKLLMSALKLTDLLQALVPSELNFTNAVAEDTSKIEFNEIELKITIALLIFFLIISFHIDINFKFKYIQ